MSFINLDDDQRWVPTHVQVTVLRGRGLRAKGKHGTSDVYTVIQVGKEKFTTAVVEKTTAPEWTEECAFELLPGVLEEGGLSAYPPGSSDLVLTVMHRALIGPDVFLGHVVLPLDKVFQDKICLRNEWYKLRSKSGRKEKERGELQITVQFTRNNLTASMFDLSVKDKPRSAFGKLKDRMTGKKWGDSESASAIVPGGYAVLSGGGRRLSGEDGKEEEEGKRSKVKSFFLKGKLRRSSDAQSSTSLASECSMTSSPGGSLSPTAGINMLVSDLSNSPSENSNYPTDSSPVHPVQPPPKVMTHKRAFSDEASRVTVALPRPRAVETLRAQSGVLSRSTLCINGSHVYGGEPSTSTSTLPPTLGLLQKCAPLSRSLQNLARRADDPRRSPSTARRWSFDRSGKEEKTTPAADAPSGQALLPATPSASTAVTGADPSSDSKKQKRNLFSQGRSESAGKGPDTPKGEQGQAPPPSEERYKGWFSAKDSHSKPSQEVSPMVETSTDVHCHPSPRSPNHLPPCSSPASASPGSVHHANPFTPSPATPPISPSNPFFTRLQCNPFYEELLADQAQKTASPTPPCLSRSPPWPSAPSPSWPGSPSPALHTVPQGKFIPRRERPVGVSRQRSLPALLTGQSNSSPNPFSTRSMSESGCEWDESFEAFATSRLKSPRGPAHRMNSSPKEWSVGGIAEETIPNDVSVTSGRAPPLPPRRPVRTPVKEGRRDSWLDRAQELAVKKEACLLSQTDAASMLHRRVGDSRRNAPCSSQLPPSDREAEGVQTAKPLMTPSDLSSRQAHERPRMRLPEKSASLENYGSLRMSGEGTRKMSFEDLHAKVAPSLRSRSGIDGTSPGLTLHGSAPRASSAPSPVAKTNAPSALFPLPTPIPPTVRQPAETARAAVPSSTASPAIGSARTVLPKETRPATSSLSRQESSPHLVKPLTSSAPKGEKKIEGRSVLVSGLEKLKSTIHPGRASQPGESEAEREKSLSESAAQYSHLTNNEIIALLLQREAELEKQGAEFERQEALLEKREVELKKMKVQVRDLEDYIDRLLVRIMEQTPTLLQVRSRYK
ncbi:hypothetical protein AGOR_G00234910 [Albula goreensis]|uniref:Rab11 family-interacting protein 5 n=1 Tax=Albula goreensis TaxID=1534307 RepID=A0A8T3CKY1_9TELE|nr:hypothetical protein AGOR_G00234910 [Albula goreensis]